MGYRWTGRQTDKVPRERGGEGDLGREEGIRAQIAHPLGDIPCPAESGKTHPVCLGGGGGRGWGAGGNRWEDGFFKKQFPIKHQKNLREKSQQKFPSLKYLALAVGLAWLPLAPALPIAVARPGPLLGQLPAPLLPPRARAEHEAGVCRWASRCPWVPVWKLESLVAGREEGMSEALGGGRVQRAPSSPRVQPRSHLRAPGGKPSGEQGAEVLRALVFMS